MFPSYVINRVRNTARILALNMIIYQLCPLLKTKSNRWSVIAARFALFTIALSLLLAVDMRSFTDNIALVEITVLSKQLGIDVATHL